MGKMEENLGLKMLSKIAMEMCVLSCVFSKTEKKHIYIGVEIRRGRCLCLHGDLMATHCYAF